MKISAPLLHIRAFTLTYSVKKFQVLCEGDPATGQPFIAHQFFRKLEATTFPNPLSKNSEKNNTSVRSMFCSRLPSLVVVAQTVLEIFDEEFLREFPNFLKITLFDFSKNNLKNVWEGVSNET